MFPAFLREKPGSFGRCTSVETGNIYVKYFVFGDIMVPKESVIVAALQRGKKIKPSTSQTSQMKLHGGPLFFGARHLGKWSQSSRSLTFFSFGDAFHGRSPRLAFGDCQRPEPWLTKVFFFQVSVLGGHFASKDRRNHEEAGGYWVFWGRKYPSLPR